MEESTNLEIEKYNTYLKNRVLKLQEELLKFPELKELGVLLEALSKDLFSDDKQVQLLVKRFLDYIEHISERIEEYNDSNQEFRYNSVKANKLLELIDVLKKLIPLKKEIYDETKKKKLVGEKSKKIELLIEKFDKGHGIHELDKALKYWDLEEFFKLPLTKEEIFFQKIKPMREKLRGIVF
jgi:hypothetical protein